MIRTGPLEVDQALAGRARAVFDSPSGLEGTISFLRSEGLGKIETMKILCVISGMTLGDAKQEVHLSRAWRDRRASDDAFHDSLYRAALEDGWVEGEALVAEPSIPNSK